MIDIGHQQEGDLSKVKLIGGHWSQLGQHQYKVMQEKKR